MPGGVETVTDSKVEDAPVPRVTPQRPTLVTTMLADESQPSENRKCGTRHRHQPR
jgi:hypothetical protein